MMISLFETVAFSCSASSFTTLRLRPSHRRLTTTLPFQKHLVAAPGFEFVQMTTASLTSSSSSLSATNAPSKHNCNNANKPLQQDKFDFGILPEGRLIPNTAQGLLPIFPAAYTLAKMCHTYTDWDEGIAWNRSIVASDSWIMECSEYVVIQFLRHYTSAEDLVQTVKESDV